MSSHTDAVVATFAHHHEADSAVRKLAGAGLDMKHFTCFRESGRRILAQGIGLIRESDIPPVMGNSPGR